MHLFSVDKVICTQLWQLELALCGPESIDHFENIRPSVRHVAAVIQPHTLAGQPEQQMVE